MSNIMEVGKFCTLDIKWGKAMKLSKESIDYILNLQKNKLPFSYYCNEERKEFLLNTIKSYDGKAVSIEENIYLDNSSILMFLDDVKKNDIQSIEKFLIKLRRKVAVILDIQGIDFSIYKRNLVLSFLNKENINIIKSTKTEIDRLIKMQYNNVLLLKNEGNFKYREFSRKNNIILILSGDNYYVTDGYSEFYIKNSNEVFKDMDHIENIQSIIMASIINICKGKCEVIKGVLISILILVVSEELTLNAAKLTKENKENLENTLLKEIHEMNVDKISSYGHILYKFKR